MQVKEIETQRLLSKTQIDLADFVINPYRGCAFGCRYCYSQQNKNIRKRNQEWGDFLDVKINAASVLQRELTAAKPRKVLLGSTTECFQPQEKDFKITQTVLKLLKERNIPLVILTKSSAIREYIPLINFHPENKVYFTLMFSHTKIKDLFERNAPDLKERIKTIRMLINNGIKVKVHIGPFIPYLEDLSRLFKLIPKQIQEVEIEVYNAKMGNFDKVIKIVNDKVSAEKADAIKRIYSSLTHYDDFTKRLRAEAEALNKDYGFKINFIIPGFDSWYTDKIKYE